MSALDIIVMVGQLLLGISILVGVHEAGHMLAAKAFGMRVEKFFIGFPPKVFGFTKGETEYGLGALPLGGFVKISGMIDESLDTKQLATEPEPWEFRAKPAWQRLIVMLGGIIMNVITGILIFTCMVYSQGEKFYPASEVKYGIKAGNLAQQMGLQTGDKIVAINGKPYKKFSDVMSPDLLLGSNNYYNVDRNGQQLEIAIPNDLIDRLADRRTQADFIDPIYPFEVERVVGGSPASKAGVQAGDRITNIGGKPIRFYHELQQTLQEFKGKTVDLQLERNGQTLPAKATVNEDGRLGFMARPLLKDSTLQYSFLGSVPRGAQMAWDIVYLNVKGFGKIFKGEVSASNSVQGPIAMAQDLYGGTWDWMNFWRITGLISMALAFFNLLPIPALDGGHVVFLLYEMVAQRKPGLKFMELAQKTGMVLLLALMVFVFFNDIFKRLF